MAIISLIIAFVPLIMSIVIAMGKGDGLIAVYDTKATVSHDSWLLSRSIYISHSC